VVGHLSSRASGSAQLVLIRLATHAPKGENGGGITVGRRTLARETGLAGQTVDDKLTWLREAGLIKRDGRGAHGTWKHRIILCDACQRPSSKATGEESSGLVEGRQRPSGWAKTTVTTGGETESRRLARLAAEASRDGDRADPGEAPPDPLPGTSRGPRTPRVRSDERAVAADASVTTPATALAVGRAPPSFEAALFEPLTLDRTQGDEMGSNGETHEQTLAADGGPGAAG
jgi:hypothetical protein